MANKTEIAATPGGYEIIITREFDAPVAKVWRTYTDPELMIKWVGPRGYEGKVDDWEFKPGGRWGFTHGDGQADYGFHGFFHTIKEATELSRTFEFHGWPDHVSFETAYFEDMGDGRTRVKAVSVFQSPEDRDGMIKSGMEKGVAEGNERLDELLQSL
jgi:uncharacterized protein YndB with AHSA1/START domain